MPRRLPPLPSLEHLKKEAKQLRRELREQRPDASLSEAQFAVARRYGYASWPRLKAHVAALQPDALNARLAGTWTADRETFGPSAAGRFRPAQMRFALDSDLLTISHVRVDGLGREERGSYSIAADGREHPRGTSGCGRDRQVDRQRDVRAGRDEERRHQHRVAIPPLRGSAFSRRQRQSWREGATAGRRSDLPSSQRRPYQ